MKTEKTAPREQGAAVRSKTIKRLINSNFTNFGDSEIPTGSRLRFQTAEEKAAHKEAISKVRRRFRNRQIYHGDSE